MKKFVMMMMMGVTWISSRLLSLMSLTLQPNIGISCTCLHAFYQCRHTMHMCVSYFYKLMDNFIFMGRGAFNIFSGCSVPALPR